MAAQDEFELKVQLTNEYLRNGGTEKIPDPNLLQDLIDFRVDVPATHSPRLRAFMNVILHSHLIPPYVGHEAMPEYQSLLQKSFFFDQVEINTEAEFDVIYDKYKNAEGMLFRGQREAAWRLYNKLQRSWITEKLEEKGWSIETLLERLADKGRETFDERILELLKEHNVDVLNDLAVLGFLQHHGCPTPLMDWTYSFRNALYFGLDHLSENEGPKEINNYFSVYYIEEENLSGMRKLMEEIFEEQGREAAVAVITEIAKDDAQRIEMEEHFKGRSLFDIKRVFGSGLIKHLTMARHLTGFDLMFFSDKDAEKGFIFSLNNSHNIVNQQGVFVLNASPYKPLEVAGKDNYAEAFPEGDTKEYRFCECFNIKKSLAPYIIKKLEADGITKDHIYPTPEVDSWPVYIDVIGSGT
ncbi:FRG domain-containing protein [Flavobacterium sp. D11R37]|uniref:FRG domain-containing protein n=1 Tax=Flavobacterium coralii TaxID=2838017 RepID=UPI001CA7717D|nr:FRG domain-containing protein [Flavobacterium coralii]MBY8961793.1 FRG domain-containing protein [Flavobacterium coralii]